MRMHFVREFVAHPIKYKNIYSNLFVGAVVIVAISSDPRGILYKTNDKLF